jgi:HD superfamily phosphodiesterase
MFTIASYNPIYLMCSLRGQDMMKTDAGKRMALHRHRVMEDFLTEFGREWDGKA